MTLMEDELQKKRSEVAIRKIMERIEHPQYRRTLAELGMFSRLETEKEGELRLYLKTAEKNRKTEIELEARLRQALAELQLPGKLKIKFEQDKNFSPGESSNRIPGVKNIIAVASGKGGVGKSTVAANLAAAFRLQGKEVGLIDGDIYGPSLGKMFGISGKLELGGDQQNRILPPTVEGIKLISFSFLLSHDQAVIWRGPMLGKAMEQFLFQVAWGNLDYLVLDLPPGTGDVQLSLAQLTELDGALIVTTPQNMSLQDARRAAQMFLQLKVPILGVIENMTHFTCPHCGHETHIFSKNGGAALAADLQTTLLGSIPIEEKIMASGEAGRPILFQDQEGPLARAYLKITERLPEKIEQYR